MSVKSSRPNVAGSIPVARSNFSFNGLQLPASPSGSLKSEICDLKSEIPSVVRQAHDLEHSRKEARTGVDRDKENRVINNGTACWITSS